MHGVVEPSPLSQGKAGLEADLLTSPFFQSYHIFIKMKPSVRPLGGKVHMCLMNLNVKENLQDAKVLVEKNDL